MVCVLCREQQRLMFEYQNSSYFRCVGCALVSTYPVPDLAALQAHYAQKFLDGNYRLLQEYSTQYRAVYEDFARVLKRRLGRRGQQLAGLDVLDIGCFTGEFLHVLMESGASVYGLELQTEAVQIAAEKFPGRIFQADVLSKDFPQVKCDIITLLGVLEHVLDPIALLRRAAELLNPCGLLMIQTPNSTSLLARLLGKLWPPYAPIEHIHLFSSQSVKTALRDIGFVDIEITQHWKRLPISYIYFMLRDFGPEFHAWLRPLYRHLPHSLVAAAIPCYAGEMIVTAIKV